MQFPASAANSLITGYCDDFVSLAATLAQTLEQVSMRAIDFTESRPSLERIEQGMRDLAEAIHDLLERGQGAPGRRKSVAETLPLEPPPPAAPAPPAPALRSPATTTAPRAAEPTQPPSRPRLGAAQPTSPTRSAPGPAPAVPPSPQPARSLGAASSLRTTRPPVPPGRTNAPLSASAATPRSAPTGTLKGTNRSMPLLSVFQFLGRMRKNGTVHVTIADETLAFEFVNGCIEFTTTDKCPPHERLGELLVEMGFTTREALAPLLSEVGASSAHRLGHLVIEARVCSNGQVLEALEAQVKRRFQRVCTDPEAAYEFEEGRRLPGDGRIRITPFELSFEPRTGRR